MSYNSKYKGSEIDHALDLAKTAMQRSEANAIIEGESMRVSNEEDRVAEENARQYQEYIRQQNYYNYLNQIFDGGRADTNYGQGIRVLDCGGADAFLS